MQGFTQSVKVYEDLDYIKIKNINNKDKELLSLDDASNNL